MINVVRAPDKMQALRELRARNIPVETVIDVGVLSQTAELIAVFPDKPHLLFEAVEEFSDIIHQNYAKIDHTLVTAAVSDAEGEATLKVKSVLEGVKISHSGLVEGEADSADKRTVPTVTLDGYLSRNPQKMPYLLKLDVDGFEMQIMQGASETLKNCSVVIVEAPKAQLTKRVAYLEARGFEIFDLVEPCYYDSSFWQCDAVMLKRSLQAEHFEQLHKGFSNEKYEPFRLT